MHMKRVLGLFCSVILLAACNAFQTGSPVSPSEMPAPTDASGSGDSPQPTLPSAECPSGECRPTGDLPGWRLIFADDFTVPVALGQWSDCSLEPMICRGLPEPYRERWWAFLGGWTDNANGLNSPSKTLSVADGILDIYLHTEGGVHLVAAPVPLIHGRAGPLGQLYGRYAIRFRSDSLHGYKVAWLLWPDSETWPRDGEIDFPEGNLDATIEAYLHRQDGTAGNDAAGFSSGVRLSGDWHTAVIEWNSDMVNFILDGKVIGATMDRIPDTPMHWVLEAYTAFDGTVPDDETAGHVQIDWVSVYALNGPVEPRPGFAVAGRIETRRMNGGLARPGGQAGDTVAKDTRPNRPPNVKAGRVVPHGFTVRGVSRPRVKLIKWVIIFLSNFLFRQSG